VLSGEKIENDLAVLGLTIYDLILMNGSSDVLGFNFYYPHATS
jgi:hypothetical protein